MEFIQIQNEDLATAVEDILNEVLVQDALINIKSKNYNRLKDLQHKMDEVAAQIVVQEEETTDDFLERVKELGGHVLRVLRHYNAQHLKIPA